LNCKISIYFINSNKKNVLFSLFSRNFSCWSLKKFYHLFMINFLLFIYYHLFSKSNTFFLHILVSFSLFISIYIKDNWYFLIIILISFNIDAKRSLLFLSIVLRVFWNAISIRGFVFFSFPISPKVLQTYYCLLYLSSHFLL